MPNLVTVTVLCLPLAHRLKVSVVFAPPTSLINTFVALVELTFTSGSN